MKNQGNEFEFILNRWAYGKNGAVMNVAEIKKARAETAGQVLELLKALEAKTGMVVSMVDLDIEYDADGHSTGLDGVTVGLELE